MYIVFLESSSKPLEAGVIITYILQMRKPGKVKKLAQGHTASEYQSVRI